MKISKILKMFVVILMLITVFASKVKAASINEIKDLERGSKGYYCVQKWDGSKWIYLTYNQIFYTDTDGQKYIAYCLCPGLPGVGYVSGEKETYQVKVKEILNNDVVWRIIKNGYPYKSVQELGLEADDDAYFATMQAINCVLRGYTLEQAKELYTPGKFAINGENLQDIQRRGTKTLNVMYNLIDIGLNGNEKRSDLLNISIVKISDFQKENDEFYSQSFKIESSSEIIQYKISKLENFPEGSYIADLQGNKKESFQKGENFKVVVPTKKITADINGKISIVAKQKNYPIFYSNSMLEGYQDFALCNNVYSEVYESADVYVNSNKSKLIINKIDSETNNPIKNVKFKITNSYGEETIMSTNEKGQIVIANQRQGEMLIKEIEAGKGYRLDSNELKIMLNYNETKEITIKNDLQKGNIKIIKVDKENNEIKLKNVKFELYDENNKKVKEGVTNENGELKFENLLVGKYTLVETETNNKYEILEEPVIVEVEDTKTSEVKIENELQKGNIKVIKVDKENNEIKLKNVKFELYDENNKKVKEGVTNENGELKFENLLVGKYTLVETATNNKYEILKEPVIVEVKNAKTSEVKIENELQKGNIKVIKVDKENNEIKLENVKFELYDENNKKVKEGVTNENGELVFENLLVGEYTLVESATREGYIISDIKIEVKVENKNTKEIVVENEKKVEEKTEEEEEIEEEIEEKEEIVKVIEEKELPKTGGSLNLCERIWYVLVFSTYIIMLIRSKIEK